MVSMFTAPLVSLMFSYTRRAVLHRSVTVMALSSSSVVRVSGPSAEIRIKASGCAEFRLLRSAHAMRFSVLKLRSTVAVPRGGKSGWPVSC